MKYCNIIPGILLALLCISCIKEDRSKCPCYLHVDLSRVDSHYIHSVDLVLDDNIRREWISVDKELIGDTLIVPVCKSEFDLCAWGNLRQSMKDETTATICQWTFADSLWSYTEHFSAFEEDEYVHVMPLRQYIPVTIIVRGMIGGISNLAPEFDYISSTFSYMGDPAGARAKNSPALVSLPSEERYYYLYRTMILTQENSQEAVLNLDYDRDEKSEHSSFPIGRVLLESGVDISVKGQNPVIVDLTIGSASIFLNISVADWETHGVYEITY